jgi:hypothetical protein
MSVVGEGINRMGIVDLKPVLTQEIDMLQHEIVYSSNH